MTAQAPLDPSILDLLRHSTVGPMLDRPVNAVLADLGLPALPQPTPVPPLPGMPPLPVIDLSTLFKPLTDLASAFGTGRLGANGAPDPAQALADVADVLQGAMSLGSSALQLLLPLWQGSGADAAATKAGQAQGNGVALAGQSLQTSTGVQAASATVGVGAAEMAAIIARFSATVAAAAPAMITPLGQAFVLGMGAESLGEATAVTAKTRAELTVHTAKMAAIGTKIAITNAPSTVSSSELSPSEISSLGQMSQMLGQFEHPLGPAAGSGVSGFAPPSDRLLATVTPSASITENLDSSEPAVTGLASALGIATPGAGDIRPGTVPLQAWTGSQALQTGQALPEQTFEESASPMNIAPPVADAAPQVPGSMPIAPVAAGAGPIGRGVDDPALGDGSAHTALVTAEHGKEVAGDSAPATAPVVGGSARTAGPADIELIL